VEIVQLLIAVGADLEAQDLYGNTALAISIYKDKSHIVDTLIEAGASTSRMNSAYLLNAVSKSDAKQVERLLSMNVDVNIRNTDGLSPLACAANAGHHEVVAQLVAAGADLEVGDANGKTPLMLAIGHGNTLAIQELLRLGASVHTMYEETGENISDWAYYAAIRDETRSRILKILKDYDAPEPSLSRYKKLWKKV
jgi:ankyrin repeat protein